MFATTLLNRNPTLPPHAARVHALKNCLAVVRAVHALLEPELSGPALARLRRAQNAVVRMVSLLEEEVLPASRSEEVTVCSSADVIRAVAARVEDRAEAEGVELRVYCGSGTVLGVPDDLVEALANVVLNAIEVTPRGSAVLVSAFEGSDETAFWTVRDSGPGMPAETVALLGTPHCSQKRGGWGLGLAVTRSIVDRHGGFVHVDSRPGAGTLVTLCFPPRCS
jgi:signal transduction histidine kinase